MAGLAMNMGMDPMQKIDITDKGFSTRSLPPLDALKAAALANRHEIKEQEMRISIAQEEQRLAKSQLYPEVSIIADGSASSDYRARSNTFFIGMVHLSMPLFEFGATRANVRSKALLVTKEEKTLQSVKGTIVQDVIGAYAKIHNWEADIETKKKAVEQATEFARLMRAQFDQNLTSLSSLMDAEYTLYASRKALSDAKYNLRIAYLELLKSTGQSYTSAK